jgi:hypothetical protein
MSRKSNVNPDHYKVAGRDRPDDIARARREVPPTGGKPRRKKGDPASNFIPGAAPVDASPKVDNESGGKADRR